MYIRELLSTIYCLAKVLSYGQTNIARLAKTLQGELASRMRSTTRSPLDSRVRYNHTYFLLNSFMPAGAPRLL